MQLLLSRGASVNVRDSDGDTPFDNAHRWLYYLVDEDWLMEGSKEIDEASEVCHLIEQAGGGSCYE